MRRSARGLVGPNSATNAFGRNCDLHLPQILNKHSVTLRRPCKIRTTLTYRHQCRTGKIRHREQQPRCASRHRAKAAWLRSRGNPSGTGMQHETSRRSEVQPICQPRRPGTPGFRQDPPASRERRSAAPLSAERIEPAIQPCEKLITRDAFAPGRRGVARLEIGACPFEIVVGEMDHALDCPGEGSVN
jgi:hypothetical protein